MGGRGRGLPCPHRPRRPGLLITPVPGADGATTRCQQTPRPPSTPPCSSTAPKPIACGAGCGCCCHTPRGTLSMSPSKGPCGRYSPASIHWLPHVHGVPWGCISAHGVCPPRDGKGFVAACVPGYPGGKRAAADPCDIPSAGISPAALAPAGDFPLGSDLSLSLRAGHRPPHELHSHGSTLEPGSPSSHSPPLLPTPKQEHRWFLQHRGSRTNRGCSHGMR